MTSEGEVTLIKSSGRVSTEDTNHKTITRTTRHMIPIDFLSQDFSISMDTEVVVKRFRKMLQDCNIDEIGTSGVTALTQSALDGRLESVKFLIELGADVNKKDRFGWTPLHYAASEGYENICRYLLQGGADASLRNKQGEFPVELADDDNIASMLLDATISAAKNCPYLTNT